MSITLAADSPTQYNLIRFTCGGETCYGQWNDSLSAYQLTDFGSAGTGVPSATTYSTLATLFAAAKVLINPYATNTAEPGGLVFIDCNPEHVYMTYDGTHWQIADFGPSGTGIYGGNYTTLALAFTAAAALF